MIYRTVSVEMSCDSTVPEESARILAANMAHAVRAAAYSWIAVQDVPDGVDFIVDGEHVNECQEVA